MNVVEKIEFYGHELEIGTGLLAKQADGSVVVRIEDTMVLVTVCLGESTENLDFFPLTVEYREKTYAAGRFPGGFFKREGKPTIKEILTSRLIDRSIRPLFPESFKREVQVVASVISAGRVHDPDIPSIIGASCALGISSIPFGDIIGAVRVGCVDGKFVINPTKEMMDTSTLDLVVSGTREGIVMVEAGAQELPEAKMLDAVFFGHEAIKKLIDIQDKIISLVAKPKLEVEKIEEDKEVIEIINTNFMEELQKANITPGKLNRKKKIKDLEDKIITYVKEHNLITDEEENIKKRISKTLHELVRKDIRRLILEGKRIDGRGLDDIRELSAKIGIIPNAHGSALFTRGETQALVYTTLGTEKDEFISDEAIETISKRFYLHYNFPPFCVGEVKPFRGPGRREIGHGALAERALLPVIPPEEEFPYVLRIVSDILESNGSSSMATVCGGTLSLMDAGVPIKSPVAGVAMGLVKEGEVVKILTDIQGEEDHEGDMDFKVAGTREGVTALQMDIKISGIDREIMEKAFAKARIARFKLLDFMASIIKEPRANISSKAPRLVIMSVPLDKIGLIIGTGGKTIRHIIEQTNVEINIDDMEGKLTISAENEESALKAKEIIERLINPKIGDIYEVTVKGIKDFGVFVEVFPGVEGMIHISELSHGFVSNIQDIVKIGEKVKVKLVSIDEAGRLRFSKKALEEASPVYHKKHHNISRNYR